MKVLLTGASGYIGKRILPVLVNRGYQVICCIRDVKRFNPPKSLRAKIEIIEVNLLEQSTLKNIPRDIDGAYYLVHSMSSSKDYDKLELKSASNFREALEQTNVQHVVYLSGIMIFH